MNKHDEKLNNPDITFRCGHVAATVWTNTQEINGNMVQLQSIKIEKSYPDKSYKGDDPKKKWKYTNSFYADDLPKVIMVASEAYKHIRLQVTNNEGHSGDNQQQENT
jgi:hypothetical protein